LQVNHGWADAEKLKKPKNGETRRVPLLPTVRGLLLDLLAENPHDTEGGFIFYSEKPDRPCSAMFFLRNLRRAIRETANRPLGWSQEPPEGSAPLWVIKGEKNSAGDLTGGWSEPERTAGMRSAEDEKTTIRNHYFEYRYQRSETKPDTPIGIVIGERRIVFHSFRHENAARLAVRMEPEKVAKLSGHKSKRAAAIYQNHQTERRMNEAGAEMAEEFANILPFKGKEGIA
jgi:integrase